MTLRVSACLTMLLAFPALSAAQEHPSPYVERRSAQVKTLSQAEVDELLAGSGMGVARPAELNGFPGPRHVLDLADSLALFAGGAVDEATLAARLDAIEALRADLRLAHLRAHLETRALLMAHQIHTYDRLRGYGGAHIHGGD